MQSPPPLRAPSGYGSLGELLTSQLLGGIQQRSWPAAFYSRGQRWQVCGPVSVLRREDATTRAEARQRQPCADTAEYAAATTTAVRTGGYGIGPQAITWPGRRRKSWTWTTLIGRRDGLLADRHQYHQHPRSSVNPAPGRGRFRITGCAGVASDSGRGRRRTCPGHDGCLDQGCRP
jgi:hypothetical protein